MGTLRSLSPGMPQTNHATQLECILKTLKIPKLSTQYWLLLVNCIAQFIVWDIGRVLRREDKLLHWETLMIYIQWLSGLIENISEAP